jgi:hypothetical protein
MDVRADLLLERRERVILHGLRSGGSARVMQLQQLQESKGHTQTKMRAGGIDDFGTVRSDVESLLATAINGVGRAQIQPDQSDLASSWIADMNLHYSTNNQIIDGVTTSESKHATLNARVGS